ncbi:MAG: WcaI family glycosyltransferase [Chloroflexi bacterium]|nr:WcaI family glycosyltransferase [Chloroflexota bacterium]
MNILVLGMNYVPEKTAIGPLTADMCAYLAQRGHDVAVATGFPHYPEWRVYDGYRGRLFAREVVSGVAIHRGYVYVPGKPNAPQRVIYDTSIALSAGLSLLKCAHPDVMVVLSPPLQLVLTSIAAGRVWRAPVLLVIKDIVPDVAVSVGLLKNPAAIRLASAMERICYRCVDRISVISQGFASNLMSKGVPKGKISLIPDWVDLDSVRPLDRMSRFRRNHGIGADTFVVLYAGNMSLKQGLENVLLAAEQLRDQASVHFFLVGEGTAREGLCRMADHRRLSNVTFLPFESEEMFPEMLAAADILLLSQRADVRDAVLPSKFLKYMGAGRPVVAAVHADSETALYVARADCGDVVPPEQPVELADAIRRLAQDECLRRRFGTNGRAFAEKHFSRDEALRAYEELLIAMKQ